MHFDVELARGYDWYSIEPNILEHFWIALFLNGPASVTLCSLDNYITSEETRHSEKGNEHVPKEQRNHTLIRCFLSFVMHIFYF